MRFAPVLAFLVFCSGPAMAQSAPCDPPQDFWTTAVTLDAARNGAGAGAARLTPGKTAMLRLRPVSDVTVLAASQSAEDAASFGGVASFDVTTAGRYSVGLEKRAWVDVMRDGAPEQTVSSGRAPECSAMHKKVTFELAPGTYVLELSRNRDEQIGVLIEPLDGN